MKSYTIVHKGKALTQEELNKIVPVINRVLDGSLPPNGRAFEQAVDAALAEAHKNEENDGEENGDEI
jgi:hypothetical protein